MEQLTLLLSAVMAVCSLLLLVKKRSTAACGNLPPGPPPLPVFGNLFQLGSSPNESLARLAARYGPLMTLRLGQVTTVVVSSITMAKEVLQKHDQAVAGRSVGDSSSAMGYSECSLVWAPPGQHWRRLRYLCATSIFSAARLNSGQGLRRLKVAELLAYVDENCSKKCPIDVGKAAFVTTLNLVSNTIFSVDAVDMGSKSAHEFKDLVWAMLELGSQPNLVDFFPLLRPFDPQGIRRKATSYLHKLYAIFEKQIRDRQQARAEDESMKKNDFLDALLDVVDKGELSLLHLKPLFVDLFVAGSSTSSDTVEWAAAELLRHPEAMVRARSELEEVIGRGKQMEESDIPHLPYLQSIVKETFRMHPPVPFISRRTECDVTIDGYIIPKHTKLLIHTWVNSRDGGVWEAPDQFRPERFLSSEMDYRGRHFELIPFGSGRRICPGLPLADRMVHLLLGSLLHSFDWADGDGMGPEQVDLRAKFGLTMPKAKPLMAVPVRDSV